LCSQLKKNALTLLAMEQKSSILPANWAIEEQLTMESLITAWKIFSISNIQAVVKVEEFS